MTNWYDIQLGMKDHFENLLHVAEEERFARWIEKRQIRHSERRSIKVKGIFEMLPILMIPIAQKILHG